MRIRVGSKSNVAVSRCARRHGAEPGPTVASIARLSVPRGRTADTASLAKMTLALRKKRAYSCEYDRQVSCKGEELI
jgi:hypothetical protein